MAQFWKDSRPVRHVEAFLDVMSEVGTNRNYRVVKEKILKREEQEVVTMTEVEKEYWAEATRSGMERGMEQGMAKGSDMKLISMVCRKLQKGKEPEEIAEDLEEEFELVERICKVAGENSAGYDVDMIYQALQLEMV